MLKWPALFLLLLTFSSRLYGQECTGIGHTPSSAILLCGSVSYQQLTVPICGQTQIPVPCNGTFQNTNATWFKVNCYTSGSFGFIVMPREAGDNYDWQLFDISGRNDDDVFRDQTLFVACNWSPEPGNTGATGDGTSLTVCSNAGENTYSQMPDLIQGREYLILVSQRSNSDNGFAMVVTGGSASITDPEDPDLASVRANCDGTKLTLVLNKRMNCSTVAADGSDFILDRGANIVAATIYDCVNNQSNNVELTLDQPLAPGDYTFSIKEGTDGNTVVDYCGTPIAVNNQLPLSVTTILQSPLDRIIEPECSPSIIRVLFKRRIRCNSLAADGSDFVITGPQGTLISGFTSNCTTGPNAVTSTDLVLLNLSTPLDIGGAYRLSLRSGSDGNTIIDECGLPAAAGLFLDFVVRDGVSATFDYNIDPSCERNRVSFVHDGNNGVNDWKWNFGNNATSNIPNPVIDFAAKGDYEVQLIVSNGFCKDTSLVPLHFDNRVEALFEVSALNCPEDMIVVTNKSQGTIDNWKWNFGAGVTSTLQSPIPFQYPASVGESQYEIVLIASSLALSCSDTFSVPIKVLSSCYIAIPSAFTPNGDGLNDFLFPLNAIRADELQFRVFNRAGQLVFETKDWTRQWDGRVKGKLQDTGVFAWTLQYKMRDTGKKVTMKGTTLLLRK